MPTSKPTNIDAQRILAIMDELKEKLTFLSVATSQVLSSLQSEEGQATTELLGNDLMKQFADQTRLEDNYIADSAPEDVRALQKSTLELCRKMRAVPNIVSELRNFQETRPSAVITFLKTIADMQELTFKRLTTTVEEERSRQELLEHYQHRQEEATRRRKQLEADLNHIRRESERAQSSRTEILTKLKADLLDVKDSKLEKMNALRNRYETRMREHQEAFQQRKEDLEKKINALKEQNTKLCATSQEEEMAKKKMAKRYEMEVAEKINQYDSQVKQMAFELGEHMDAHKKELRKLNDLRERFEKVDEEKTTIAREEDVTNARKAKMEAEKRQKNMSAALVQAFWRGIIQREQYVSMKKNAKKGKKKGQKGKKK